MAWLTFFVSFSEVGLGDIWQRIILYNPILFVLSIFCLLGVTACIGKKTFPGYKQMYLSLVSFHDCLNRCVAGTRVPSSAMFKTLYYPHTKFTRILYSPIPSTVRSVSTMAPIPTSSLERLYLHLLTIFKLQSLLFDSQVLTGARPHRR